MSSTVYIYIYAIIIIIIIILIIVLRHLISKHFTPKFHTMELFVRDVFGYNKNKYIDIHNKSAKMVNKQGNGLSLSKVMDCH